MKINPVTTADDLAKIIVAATAENHPVLDPSHMAVNEAGDVRGYFSAGRVNLGIFWSSVKNTPLESMKIVKAGRAELARQGKLQILLCDEISPFHALMPRIGFARLGNSDLFILK